MAANITALSVSPGTMLRSRASGLLFFAFFGTGWALTGAFSLSATWLLVLFILIACITLLIVGIAISFLRKSRQLPKDTSSEARQRSRQIGRTFGIVFGAEGGLIFLASVILAALHLPNLLIPVVAVIVGIHFLPLAPVFHMRVYYGTGVALIVVGVVALVAILLAGQSNASLHTWYAFTGLGAAIILWITSGISIRQGLSQIRTVSSIKTSV